MESKTQGAKQIIFLAFDGGRVRLDEGYEPQMDPLITSLSQWGLGASDLKNVIRETVRRATEKLYTFIAANGANGDYARSGTPGEFGIDIRNSMDNADPGANPLVTRIIVGLTDNERLANQDIGYAQFIDVGNFKQDDQAAVSTNFIAALLDGFALAKPGNKSMTIDFVAEYMSVLISHEFGHLAGAFHTHFTVENSFNGEPVNLMDKDIRVPLGPDLVFGTKDDITMHFGVDTYDPNEIYVGIDDTLNTVAFGLSTGTVRRHGRPGDVSKSLVSSLNGSGASDEEGGDDDDDRTFELTRLRPVLRACQVPFFTTQRNVESIHAQGRHATSGGGGGGQLSVPSRRPGGESPSSLTEENSSNTSFFVPAEIICRLLRIPPRHPERSREHGPRRIRGHFSAEEAMFLKITKLGLLSLGAIALAGGLAFGTDAFSYLSSSTRSVRTAVKDAVPIEFQLRRARDLVDDIIPEMHANIRLIAQQEVEIDALKRDIDESRQRLTEERAQIGKLRDALAGKDESFTFSGVSYSREQVKEDLGRRLQHVKEAELVLSSKERLLSNQSKAMAVAMQALERTRSQKALLESQIAALAGQHKLLQATSAGSTVLLDDSKLAQSERLINEVKKQLDVSERVLAHQSRFAQAIKVDAVSEREVLTEADAYLASGRRK